MRSSIIILVFIIISCVSGGERKPNIVILLADDLGVADIGCFGNDTIRTPNIDRLASEGARLLHNVAAESVCTPSRAAILTGRYAVRSGLAANPGITRVLDHNAVSGGLPQNETTFAELLLEDGYATGLIGKWHLGVNLKTFNDFHFHPLKHGFQHFYGISQTNYYACTPGGEGINDIVPNIKNTTAMALLVIALTGLIGKLFGFRFPSILFIAFSVFFGLLFLLDYLDIARNFGCILMRDYEVVEQPYILENLTARLTDDAIKFITREKAKPFLLFMSYVKVHAPLFATKPFQGHSKHGSYGDNIEELDWSVGQILNTLELHGLKDDTFVYFTSDHGPHLDLLNGDREYIGGWKGLYKGGKSQTWEGGIRVPTVIRWPGHIKSGINITEPTSTLDILPSILQVANLPAPTDRIIDGKSFLPLLTQEKGHSPHEFMYHYCAKSIHAVRYRPRNGPSIWKAHFITPNTTRNKKGTDSGYMLSGCYEDQVITHDPPLLFDLSVDPYENMPVDSTKLLYKVVISKITEAMHIHAQSVEQVPNQLAKNVWYPWLQICCNFPFCSCVENYTDFIFPDSLS